MRSPPTTTTISRRSILLVFYFALLMCGYMRQQYKNGFWLKLFFYNMLHSSIFTRRQPNSTIKIDVFVFLFRPLLPSSNLVCSSAWNPFYTDSIRAFSVCFHQCNLCIYLHIFMLCEIRFACISILFIYDAISRCWMFMSCMMSIHCKRERERLRKIEIERDWERVILQKSREMCVFACVFEFEAK